MASKRKSTMPCMIPHKTLSLETDANIDEFKEESSKEEPSALLPITNLMNSEIQTNGHENVNGDRLFCKYCNFGSHDTSIFVNHMDTKHLEFQNDPSYVCIVCSFLVKDPKELEVHNAECHAGDTSITWSVANHESYTVVEQSVGDNNEMTQSNLDRVEFSDIVFTKTPIMKTRKNKPETKRNLTRKDLAKNAVEDRDRKRHSGLRNCSIPVSKATSSIVNGPILGTVPVLQTGVSQLVSLNPTRSIVQPKIPTLIAPLVPKPSINQNSPQQQENHSLPTAKSLPKVMIPLSSIPTYNSAMDFDSFLKNSFNKFPYPTKAELCYLTVVTKYPEEQIKIWFTAQRLKQGISWSPEEIEDSRRKMFNTVIQSIPQPMPQPTTITVLNAPLVANSNNVQHFIQAALPGQIVSQPQGAGGLLVTQPVIANGIQGSSSSMAQSVNSLPIHQPIKAKIASSAENVVNTDQSLNILSPNTPPDNYLDISLSHRCKKSKQQLNALKNSFHKSQFPSQAEVAKLTKITGLATRDVRKWFSDKRYHVRNKQPQSAENRETIDAQCEMEGNLLKEQDSFYTVPAVLNTPRRQSCSQTPDFPSTKYKERAPEQIKALESSFAQDNFPTEEEVNRLRSETKMTRREIDCWFSEKRKKLAEEIKNEVNVQSEREDDDDTGDELKEETYVGLSNAEHNSPTYTERKVNPIKINLKDLRVTESNDSIDTLDDDTSFDNEADNSILSTSKNKQNWKKTAQQRDILKQMFIHTQWPSNDVYDDLVIKTGLPRIDIVRWFGDCRYSYKNGHLKWYSRYKKSAEAAKAQSIQTLINYQKQHQMLCEEDIEDLCESTSMTADEVKAWFAGKQAEEDRLLFNADSEDLHSDADEKPGDLNAACNRFSEAYKTSESEDLESKEAGSDSMERLSIKLETGRAGIPGDGDTSFDNEGHNRTLSSGRGKQNWKKTAEQLDILKQTFVYTQWPSNEEYDHLVLKTGLPRVDIVRWFGDCRYSYKNGPLKWYSRYKKAAEAAKAQIMQTLIDYHNQHHMLCEEDIEDLCESTSMTADEVKAWFADKQAEEDRVLSNADSEDQHSDADEKPGNLNAACDRFSEVYEDNEYEELESNEAGSDSMEHLSIKLEPGRAAVTGDGDTSFDNEGHKRKLSSARGKHNWKKTAEQLDILKQTFVHTQWPSNEEYDYLVLKTGLPRVDVVRWFGDCRYSYRNGLLKWYSRYKKAAEAAKAQIMQTLIDYHNQHHMLCEEDIEDLCESTSMTADEVKAWFADKQAEEDRVLSNADSEDQHSDADEKPGNLNAACDRFSEVYEDNEYEELESNEAGSDSMEHLSIKLDAE
ncbi:zinc fingers and homeoboxes protein 3 isoform X2 [Bombina bombina]|uniref:zinc fingers and homeoboxes protein 3 isoform X2 n=1 Tax=Bombina bombina TaxID=8345 RepID=UPI00235AAEBF|nr:zinc fingers and homeoboxes protein 3 isoform X2 [Bombina bombina]